MNKYGILLILPLIFVILSCLVGFTYDSIRVGFFQSGYSDSVVVWTLIAFTIMFICGVMFMFGDKNEPKR